MRQDLCSSLFVWSYTPNSFEALPAPRRLLPLSGRRSRGEEHTNDRRPPTESATTQRDRGFFEIQAADSDLPSLHLVRTRTSSRAQGGIGVDGA